MKKLIIILLSLMTISSAFALDVQHNVGGALGTYLSLGNKEFDIDTMSLAGTEGTAISPIYDMTVETGSAFTYGVRGRLDVFISTSDVYSDKFFSVDLFVGPKGTIAFSDKVRLNVAVGAVLGGSTYTKTLDDASSTVNSLSWGFGPDFYLDFDITNNFGMGVGLVGKINYDFVQGYENKQLMLSADAYISGYYLF